MLFHLVKKDFLIVKKYVLLMLVVSILIPPLMLWRVPQYAGTLGFVLAEIFAVCMLLQYVSLKEFQYQHAAMLLNAAPYSRTQMVLSKYVFCLVIFAVCAVVFFIETLLFSQLGSLNGMMAAGTLLVLACFVGIYLPVQYRFGYEKTKFAFVVIIMASPFILPALLKMDRLAVPVSLAQVSTTLLASCMAILALCILVVSAFASVRFYRCAELA